MARMTGSRPWRVGQTLRRRSGEYVTVTAVGRDVDPGSDIMVSGGYYADHRPATAEEIAPVRARIAASDLARMRLTADAIRMDSELI